MRLWTLAFLLIATLAGLATRDDTGPLVMLGARIGFAMLVVLALLAGIRALALQMTDATPSACPRHARRPTPSDGRDRRAASRVAVDLHQQAARRRDAHAAPRARHGNAR